MRTKSPRKPRNKAKISSTLTTYPTHLLGTLPKGLTNKMTPKKFIKNLLTRSCVYFTLIMLAYIIIAAVINVTDDNLLLNAGRTVLFYVFALLLSLANGILSIGRLSGALRLILHYLIVMFAFYACLMLPLSMRASGIIVGLVIFTIIYFVVVGIVAIFRSKFRKNLEKSQDYQKQYHK